MIKRRSGHRGYQSRSALGFSARSAKSSKRAQTKRKQAQAKRLAIFKLILLIIFVTLVLIAGGYLLLSERFEIKQTIIQTQDETLRLEAQRTVKSHLDKDLVGFISRANQFILGREALKARLLDQHPLIGEVKINVQNNILELELQERQALGAWCATDQSDHCFAFDNTGLAFQELEGNSENLSEYIIFSNQDSPELRGVFAPAVEIENLIELIERLRAIRLNPQEIIYGAVTLTFNLSTENNPLGVRQVILSKTDSALALDDLALLRERGVLADILREEDATGFEYIDISNRNKVFYRTNSYQSASTIEIVENDVAEEIIDEELTEDNE